jgi:hypothetical protein
MRAIQRLTMLLFCCLALVRTAHAQESPTWHYAWQHDTWEIIALSSEGETQILLSDVGEYEITQRLTPETLFASLMLGNQRTAYHLSPTAATALVPDRLPEGFSQDDLEYMLVTHTANHAVIKASNSFPTSAFYLADFSAGTLTLVEGLLWTDSVAFSADGTMLRYVISDPTQPLWQLREREIQTDAERVITQGEENPPRITADRMHGDHWLYSAINDNNVLEYTLLNMHEETQEPVQALTVGGSQGVQILGNILLTWDWLCEQDCLLRVADLESGLQKDLRLAPGTAQIPTYAQWLDNETLVALLGNDFYRLSTEHEAEYIGHIDPSVIQHSQIKADSKFIPLMINDNGDYGVWSVTEADFVYTSALQNPTILFLFAYDNGFIFSEGFIDYTVYRPETGETFTIGSGFHTCPVLLENGDVLCNVLTANEVFSVRGIYRYSPETDTSTLYLEDANLIGN